MMSDTVRTKNHNDFPVNEQTMVDVFTADGFLPEERPLAHELSSPDKWSFSESGLPGWRLTIRPPAWRPPTDVYETEEYVVVRVEIAGMKEDDFTVELNGRFLAVRGSRSDPPERRAFHQMEIHFGEFIIEIEIPVAVSSSGVSASYSNGFLRVHLPKARPRQITIQE
jgi:HSP20 family protein